MMGFVKGDKIITKLGNKLSYVGLVDNGSFPHKVMRENGVFDFVSEDGLIDKTQLYEVKDDEIVSYSEEEDSTYRAFDMNICKEGDKLLLRDGTIATFKSTKNSVDGNLEARTTHKIVYGDGTEHDMLDATVSGEFNTRRMLLGCLSRDATLTCRINVDLQDQFVGKDNMEMEDTVCGIAMKI